MEFHYANTEAGRLEAVCDYIPSPEGNTISGVEAGTPVRAVSWQTIDNHLLIFFAADNEENVHGVMHLYSVNPVQILFLPYLLRSGIFRSVFSIPVIFSF